MASVDEHTLSIKIYLYGIESIPKDSYPVYARIIYRREKADISMKMIARVTEWDFENQMFFAAKASNRYNNNKLLSSKDELLKIFNRLKDTQNYFSVKTIRKEFRGEPDQNSSMKFLDYYDSYVNDCRKRPNEYGAGVIGHYMKTRRHLLNYMTAKGIASISLKELTRKFIADFEQYLLSTNIEGKEYAMNRNTATTYLRKLKAAINKAVAKDLLDRNPFIGHRILGCKNSKIIYLTSEEVDAIKSHDLCGNKSLIKIRDAFLFSCATGLRFSDSSTLKKQNIRKDKANVHWLRINQQKTKDLLEVPMLQQAIDIYEKYKSQREETGFVLPRMSHQKVNLYLKVIGEIVGIQKKISHHVARHTFATSLLEMGVDLKTVSKLMGHSSIKSTEIYAQVSKKNLTDVIGKLNKK
jgi:integrase/recombinase XerD